MFRMHLDAMFCGMRAETENDVLAMSTSQMCPFHLCVSVPTLLTSGGLHSFKHSYLLLPE